jgi:hypothetical protein
VLDLRCALLPLSLIPKKVLMEGKSQVLLDDGYWPTYSTEASRSTHNTWDEIGEVVIRELDFSQIHLALNTAEVRLPFLFLPPLFLL